MFNLQEELKKVRVAPAIVFGGLAVFPLIRKEAIARGYVTLSEAFSKNGVKISEVSEGGSVPELRFKNLLDQDIFAADGETLLGAKQNRVLNSSIFVGAGEEIIVPVSCVEQGRWGYNKRHFEASAYSEFVPSRAAKMASVSASLRAGVASRRSDQGAVWHAVAQKGMEFGACSPTGSMADIYDAKQHTLDEYVRNFRVQPGQVGISCAVDGDLCGIELFEETGVLAEFLPKLVRSYAAEVLGRDGVATTVPDRVAVRTLLRKLRDADLDKYAAVGKGTELRFSLGRLHGSALAVGERLIHLVLLRNKGRRSS